MRPAFALLGLTTCLAITMLLFAEPCKLPGVGVIVQQLLGVLPAPASEHECNTLRGRVAALSAWLEYHNVTLNGVEVALVQNGTAVGLRATSLYAGAVSFARADMLFRSPMPYACIQALITLCVCSTCPTQRWR